MKSVLGVFLVLLFSGNIQLLFALEIEVAPGESIQAAIDQASDGDVIRLSAGRYPGLIDFQGKALRIVGVGRKTILDGQRSGSVVTFASGEGLDSILERVRVLGGVAPKGGGILIVDSSPTVRNLVIQKNKAATSGSGIQIEGDSSPLIENNLLVKNSVSSGGVDPHGIQVASASPTIRNNTIAFTDSNGLFLNGTAQATVVNNIFAFNGKGDKGRGICDLGGTSTIAYNLFYRNTIGAILSQDFTDYKKITKAESAIGEVRIANNSDGNPRFTWQKGKRKPRISRFKLRKKSAAIDSGDPGIQDTDSTISDMGYTGGPSASDS